MENHFAKISSINNLMDLSDYLRDKSKLNITTLKDKYDSNLLHHSAFNNQLQKVKFLVKHLKNYLDSAQAANRYDNIDFKANLKAWVNDPNNQGYLPIHYACLHGNVEMLKYLQELGSNLFYKSNTGEGLLHMCAQNNQLNPMLYLYRKGLDFNQANKQQQTVLHQAAVKGFIDIVNFLVAIPEVNINLVNSSNQTALILAVKQNKSQVVKKLLLKNADRSMLNKQQKTALEIAQQKNNAKLQTILNEQYTCLEKTLIIANKKIVYRPESSSYTFVILFLILLFTTVGSSNSLIKLDLIELVIIGIFYILLIVNYLILLKKPECYTPLEFQNLESPICAECRIPLMEKSYHCYICNTCIYRYDHHCPWVNGCVGQHNIGRFAFFLLLLILALLQIAYMNIYEGIINENYRFKEFQYSTYIYYAVNAYNLIFFLFIFPIAKLFLMQMKNIFKNQTDYQRSIASKKINKKQSLLNQQSTLTEIQEDLEPKCTFNNCISMCSSRNQ